MKEEDEKENEGGRFNYEEEEEERYNQLQVRKTQNLEEMKN